MTSPTRAAPVVYTAMCKRVGKWWEITVPELESGAVTQARRLDEVPATVADLVSLMTGVDSAIVKVKVQAEEGPGIDKETLGALLVMLLTAILIVLRSRATGAVRLLRRAA